MTERVKCLRQTLITDKQQIGIEKLKIVSQTQREMAGQPIVLIRAQTFANILDQIPVSIGTHDLLLGNPASYPYGLEIDEDVGIWDEAECNALREDGFQLREEDQKEISRINRECSLFGVYNGANVAIRQDERLDRFVETGLLLPPWKHTAVNRVGGGSACSGLGLGPAWMLYCIDYELPLYKGFNTMIEECGEELRKLRFFDERSYEKSCNLQAMQICLKAAVRYANRVADQAMKVAEEAGRSGKKAWADELRELAEICRRVPAEPARSFREGMQCLWFVFMMINPSKTASLGRFDQYMYPLYQADRASGEITDEQVLEYLECLRLRTMELAQVQGKETRKKHAGNARWYNMTIGGVRPDGNDASNELSYLVLDAVMDCPTTHHTVTVRVADSTPDSLLLKAIECYRKGCAMPAFAGDKSYIDFFTSTGKGISVEKARNYCMAGCIDGAIPGDSCSALVPMFTLPLALEIFLHRGISKRAGKVGMDAGDMDKFDTYDDFLSAFLIALKELLSMAAEKSSIDLQVYRFQTPYPFRSALMNDGIRRGIDMMSRTYAFENTCTINAVGMINLAQSLYSIKKLVFEEKLCTLNELIAALDADWQGYELLRERCLKLSHYGNNEQEIDGIVSDMYAFFADAVQSLEAVGGVPPMATAISVTSHQPGGALTGATPDGRRSGSTLADACLSPIQGTDHSGPLAVFQSALKVDQRPYQAFLMNMKFHPSAIASDADALKLSAAIRTYFDAGGKMVQFNIVDNETLRNAQSNPDKYTELTVRVAGYSAYFTQLSPPIQDEIIRRTAHSL